MSTAISRAYRAMFFMDDDDNTPQGKLARGCFYLIYMFGLMLFCFGAVVPIFHAVFGAQP